MLDEILKREDTKNLLKEVCYNNLYNTKETKTSIDYENYFIKEKPLFTIMDALYKYKIIIDDIYYLDEYIASLKKIMKKIKNYSDIQNGINKLIVRICARKLNLKNIIERNNKQKLLSYVYKKYIVEGYMFHSIPNVYKDEIQNNGIQPEKYQNLYNEFKEINSIFKKHGLENILEKDFDDTYITFTDGFIKAYYYATNSPMFYSTILSNSNILTNRRYKKDAYYRKDYKDCISNLNKLCNRYDLTKKESDYVKKICKQEWDLLNNEHNKPTIMLVKRKVLDNNYLKDIDEIISMIDTIDIDSIFKKITSPRYDNVKVYKKIESKDIDMIELFSYKDIYINNSNVKNDSNNNEIENSLYINEHGKVLILILLGSLLITMGVIISIIIVGKGL